MKSLKIAVLAFVPLLAVGCRGIPTSGAGPSLGTSTSTDAPGTSTAGPTLGTSDPPSPPTTSAPAQSTSPAISPSVLPSAPSQTASPTQPPPAPSPSSSSPSSAPSSPASWAWCSSAAFGAENTSDGYILYNNEWNTAASPGPQTICGNSRASWQVTSSQGGANPNEVKTYPSVQRDYPNTPMSQLASLTSNYAESMPATGDYEAAYDLWVDHLSKEVMFWVDNHGQTPSGTSQGTVTFGGLTWTLYSTGGGYFAFVLNHNAPSGTVDLLGGLRYLQSIGALSGSDTLWQVNFGWEICSTGNQAETFHMTNYSLASS